jgi:DNA (cytosine-5)-methyltransferase 1
MLLLENVKGLVGHDKGKTLDTIFKTLNDIGYAVDFQVLNSKHYGVPQSRERIFILAVRDDIVNSESWRIEGTNVVAKGKKRISQYEGVKTFNFDWPTNNNVTTKLRDILETDVDEKYYLSEEKTSKLIEQLEGRSQVKESDNCEMVGMVGMKGQDNIRRVYTLAGVAPTLTTMGGGHREPKIAEEQKPQEFSENGGGISYCIDANYTKGTSVGNIGKGRRTHVKEEVRPVLTPDRIEKRQNGRRFEEDGEESFTLTAQDRHGVAEGVKPRYRIRKLTPLECWRLQGFSDDQHDVVESAGISNSQRYKMAGNAVTVNVIDAIGERLGPLLTDKSE